MKTTSFDKVLDMHIGKRGTKKREKFEQELRLELLCHQESTTSQKINPRTTWRISRSPKSSNIKS